MNEEFNPDEYLADQQFLAGERDDEIQSLLSDPEFLPSCVQPLGKYDGVTPEMLAGITSQFKQTTYEALASHLYPEGCKCHDRGGDCDWCRVYYDGMEAEQ